MKITADEPPKEVTYLVGETLTLGRVLPTYSSQDVDVYFIIMIYPGPYLQFATLENSWEPHRKK